LRRGEVSQGSLHWSEASVQDASEALATGLRHAVALGQHRGTGSGAADPIAALARRIGELRIIEIARTASTDEVLVVPALAFDTEPVAALRAVLQSPAFQRKLLECGRYFPRSLNPDMEIYRDERALVTPIWRQSGSGA
jgi:hypothetical protein